MLTPLTPGFMVVQGNQLEDLRTVATQWLKANPLKPLEHECILVQSNGIAQWLKLALASNDSGTGIAAALNIQLPGRFIWQAYRSVFPSLPTSSPFDKTPLTWRLYRLLSNWEQLCQQLGQQAQLLAPLAGFLRADQDPRRCHQLAARLADLYDQYQMYRADWLAAWEQGQDVISDSKGQLKPLNSEQQWQAIIWRQLNQLISQEPCYGQWDKASRARIQQEFIAKCKEFSPQQRPVNLPRRVLVFSISALPKQTLELLQAISHFTQVMIFVTNPSCYYWGDLVEGKELLKREYRRITQRKTPADTPAEQLHSYGHPLLASWGKQGRDFLHMLDEHDQPQQYRQLFNQQKIDLFSEPQDNGLLQQLQSDILNLRSLKERQDLNSSIDPKLDRSLQFLIAHSPQREVEILHDQLLDSFARAKEQGGQLQPRDILVMVPDINVYAPHIHAVFGRYNNHETSYSDARNLPYHICDQSQRQQNTLLLALEKLLQLPSARFTVSELSDLLDTPALRARFAISEADLPTLRRWIEGANIRWGLAAEQRQALGLPALAQNTWQFGLQRMLLGYAAGANSCWQEIEAYDEVSGLEAAILGPLAQLLDSLEHSRQQLAQTNTCSDWLEILRQLLHDFFSADSEADNWALQQLEMQLERLQQVWLDAGLEQEPLPLEVVRQEFLAGLDETSLSQKFLGGSINFATLMPMRAIPFQQLWLLGMNDKDYPRSSPTADFDLMATDYRPGDRSRREDDRYLFLEALLSARQRLVISWVGRSIQDNSERPPSVLVSQLRDHIDNGWSLSDTATNTQTSLVTALTTEHPLQAFSRSYFEQQRPAELFTYADHWRALHEPATRPAPTEQLPVWQAQAPISASDLVRFLRQPVDYFYRQRLGINWSQQQLALEDNEPFPPNSLDNWQLRNKLIEQVKQALHRPSTDTVNQLLAQELQRLQRSGQLPVMPFGQLVQQSLELELAEPLQQYQQLLTEYPQLLAPQAVQLELPELLQLEHLVADIRHNAEGEYIRLHLQASVLYKGKTKKYKHIISQWPAHLLAQLQQPVTTYLLGPNTSLALAPLEKDSAHKLLIEILQCLYAGMQKPLPLACQTGFAALEPKGKPQQEYEGSSQTRGEIDSSPALQRHWPDYDSLAAEDDFLHYAERLYLPLIKHLSDADKDSSQGDSSE